jgi:hypothetical protein
MPDMIVEDGGSTILLGGTRIDLLWLGNNHSDNTLVMLLPRERIIFTVDWLPIQAVMFRDVADGYIPEWFAGSTACSRWTGTAWSRAIRARRPPRQQGRRARVQGVHGRRVERGEAARGRPQVPRRPGDARGEAPKYEAWSGYAPYLAGNLERFCEYWSRGI